MQWQFSAGKLLLGMEKYRQLARCFSKEPEEFTVRLLELEFSNSCMPSAEACSHCICLVN